jgi:hypothetical protein
MLWSLFFFAGTWCGCLRELFRKAALFVIVPVMRFFFSLSQRLPARTFSIVAAADR